MVAGLKAHDVPMQDGRASEIADRAGVQVVWQIDGSREEMCALVRLGGHRCARWFV